MKELPPLPEWLEKIQKPEEPNDLNLAYEKRPFWDTAELPIAYPFRLELLELIRALEEKREHRSNGETALNTLNSVLAMFESARVGEKITFPMSQVDHYPISLMLLSKT